jgi:hypothetical protein
MEQQEVQEIQEIQEYLNTKLSEDTLIRILSYLHGGMILRCAAVCKFWNNVCDRDYLWLVKLCLEINFDKRFNFIQNIKLNKKIVQKWRKQKNQGAKKFYLTTRRNQRQPESKRIFPKQKNILDNW